VYYTERKEMANYTTTKTPSLEQVKTFVRSHLDDTPIIVREQNRVRVGNYVCTQSDGYWNVYSNNNLLESFTLRSSAVAWCVSRITGRATDCKTIKTQDLQYNRSIENSYIFLTKFKTTNDSFKKELMWIRYEDSIYQMKLVRARLTDYLKKIKFD
jgi:hypothetical protein